MNLFYYLKKFGNRSFASFPFGEVDSLILSQISYLNLDIIVPKLHDNKKSIKLLDLLNDELIDRLAVNTLDEKRNKKLLKALKETKRYQGLPMNYFDDIFSFEQVEQFSAVTYIFTDFAYLAYRGTDLTLLGWHEDFNMALQETVPSQDDAALYLNIVANYIKDCPLYLGGHSKGGNLAVYAALSTTLDLDRRIVKIFDHDGPGFINDIFSTDKYKNLEERIAKTTCKEAMIGILLNHSEKMTFVSSKGFSILQHDPFNWQVTKEGKFKLVKKANLVSNVFEKTCNEFIDSTNLEDRKRWIDLIFKIGMEKINSTVFDFIKHPFRYSLGIRRRFKALSIDDRKFFKDLSKKYRKIYNRHLKQHIKRKFSFKY